PPREVPQLFYQLRKKLGDIRADLPDGLVGPAINDEYGDVDSILYMITGEGADYAQLKKVAEGLRRRLTRVTNVAKINLYGYEDPSDYLVRQKGKAAVGIGVVVAKGANILELGEDVAKALAEFKAALPQGIDIEQVADQPFVVKHAMGEFTRSFVEALVIVL